MIRTRAEENRAGIHSPPSDSDKPRQPVLHESRTLWVSCCQWQPNTAHYLERRRWRPRCSRVDAHRAFRVATRESRPLRFTGRQTFLSEANQVAPMVFTRHETTKHGFVGRSGRHGNERVASRKTTGQSRGNLIARSLLPCSPLFSNFFGGRRPEPLSAHRPHQQHGLLGFHETRNIFFPCPRRLQAEQLQARQRVFHESQLLRSFFPLFPGISRYSSCTPRNRCPRAVSRRSRRPPGLLPLRRTPSESMPRNGTFSIVLTNSVRLLFHRAATGRIIES